MVYTALASKAISVLIVDQPIFESAVDLNAALINAPCQHVHKPKALLTDIGTEELAHME